jgi:hypothetical protein
MSKEKPPWAFVEGRQLRRRHAGYAIDLQREALSLSDNISNCGNRLLN